MIPLSKDQLDKVKPCFHETVKAAWARGENVPYSVVYLSDRALTEHEIQQAIRIIELAHLKDV